MDAQARQIYAGRAGVVDRAVTSRLRTILIKFESVGVQKYGVRFRERLGKFEFPCVFRSRAPQGAHNRRPRSKRGALCETLAPQSWPESKANAMRHAPNHGIWRKFRV